MLSEPSKTHPAQFKLSQYSYRRMYTLLILINILGPVRRLHDLRILGGCNYKSLWIIIGTTDYASYIGIYKSMENSVIC